MNPPESNNPASHFIELAAGEPATAIPSDAAVTRFPYSGQHVTFRSGDHVITSAQVAYLVDSRFNLIKPFCRVSPCGSGCMSALRRPVDNAAVVDRESKFKHAVQLPVKGEDSRMILLSGGCSVAV